MRETRESFESHLEHVKRGRGGDSRNETYPAGVVLKPGIVQALLHIRRLIRNFTGDTAPEITIQVYRWPPSGSNRNFGYRASGKPMDGLKGSSRLILLTSS